MHTDAARLPRQANPVLSHPDYDRRLRDHTGSADLAWASARGLGTLRAITAGGELHPALRTLRPLEPGQQLFYHTLQRRKSAAGQTSLS
jgi:hypothetical protein